MEHFLDTLANNQKVVVLSPRFVAPLALADFLFSTLQKTELRVTKVGAESLSRREDYKEYDCLIYESPEYYLNSKAKGVNEIVILGWGGNQTTTKKIVSEGLLILRVDFMEELRHVRFRAISVPLSSDLEEWYASISNGPYPLEIKEQAGNYFYLGHTPEERRELLHKSDLLSSEHEKTSGEVGGENFVVNTLTDLTSNIHPSLGKLVNRIGNDPNTTKLIKNSPKLAYALKELTDKPGKYVIYTSFSKAFGVKIITKVAESAYNQFPKILTHTSGEEEVDEFNASEKEILVTSQIPKKNLIGVTAIVIFDTYDPQIAVELVQKCCGSGCGNDDIPLRVVFLHLSGSGIGTEKLFEEKKVHQTMERLEGYESEYQFMYESSSVLQLQGEELVVSE